MKAMIRRGTQLGLVVALLAAAWVTRPVEADPDPGVGFEPEVATFVGCIGRVDRSIASTLSVGSIVRGDVSLTRVPGNGEPALVAPIDPAGGATVSLDELSAAGDVGVLVEMPTADAGGAVVMVGADTIAGVACTPASSGAVMALGGSTGNGEQLELVMTNPYAVDAVVTVGSSSENGEDSASEIASVLVPAGGTVVRNLAELLPLRQSLSVRLEAERGAVHAVLLQQASDDLAVVEAVATAQDWWLPALAVNNSSSRLVVATDSPLPVNIQIDTYKAGTITEAVVESTIEARSQLDFPIADLGGAPLGLRVSSDAPVAVALVVDGERTRAVSPATTLASEWVLPGTGLVDAARAWVFNPGEVDAELVLQPLAEGQPARAATVPARAAVSIGLETAGSGMLIRSSSEIAVMWSSRAGGLSLATGSPTSVLVE